MGVKKYTKSELPPCPDPDTYIVVKTADGFYWRKKRGTIKEAKINSVLARNTKTAKITGPAASLLFQKLSPFMHGIKKGNIVLKTAGMFMQTYHEKGVVDYSKLNGLELNNGYPLDHLFYGAYSIVKTAHEIELRLQLSKGTVRRQNSLATDYYFEAILVAGYITNNKKVQVYSDESPLYSFKQNKSADCVLVLRLPKPGVPWMLLLKVNCHEGKELAAHAKHYALKVIEVHD